MSRFWSDHVSGLAPYVAGEQPKQPDLLKLNANENPYGPSPMALQAIRDAATDGLKKYPDLQAAELRQEIAQLHGLTPDHIFVGNGSDEVLAHIFNGLFKRQGKPLLFPDITYSFYKTYCRFFDIPAHLVPLDDQLAIRVSDYVQPAVDPAGIIFANPNAPTGRALSLDDIRAIARAHADIPVVVDEAYVDFGGESAVSLLSDCDNIVVVHTFSKSRSLAGLRVGFAMAHPAIIDGLHRVKDSFNSYPLDTVAQAGAVASLRDTAYFDLTRQAVIQARDALSNELSVLGFHVIPSLTNFVFAEHARYPAVALQADLREQGILVRHFNQPRIQNFLRISIGTPEECARLLAAIKVSLQRLTPSA